MLSEFSGLAFHPEKIAYEWTTEIQIPKSKMAIDAAYAMAQAFVERTRLNNHAGKDIVEEGMSYVGNYLLTNVHRVNFLGALGVCSTPKLLSCGHNCFLVFTV